MKKIKKTIALILCLIMAIGSMSIAFGDDTKDFVGHWAEATIQKWIDEGKISGYPDGTFKPDGSITRAEFVKMVNGIIDYDGKGSITFDDVKKEDWFYDQIKIAQEIGYISGYSKTQFGPNDNITREQAAAILSRIQYLKDNSSAVNKFIDNTNISSWAVGSVGAASSNGFINGHSDGSFKPKDNLSRAEAVTMLDNVLLNAKNYIVYKDGTELNDKEIAGDLIIAKTVGDGDVYLNNIDVKGHIYVYGGGINSVYFNNVKVARIEVNKDKVRLVFDDGTTVEEIALGTEAKLENINGEIGKISIDSQGKVTLSGKFADVEVVSDSDIELSNATIENLVVNKPIKILG
ncbi:MAG: S-layer homology domain-containing protein, partial [Tissierellia bacterium]|nr:S-layer homology domain-containing protein [Tissierellia bacterium]